MNLFIPTLKKVRGMLGKTIIQVLALCGCLCFLPSPGYALKQMPVEIESQHNNYDGPGDPVGEQVVHHLKELIKKSNLLRLTSENEPRLKVIILTFDPLSQRMHLFTVFSYTFVYMNKSNMIPVYVMGAMGYAHSNDVTQASEQLNANIHRVASDLRQSLEPKP